LHTGGIFQRPALLLRANPKAGMVNIAHVGRKTRQLLIFFMDCFDDGSRGLFPVRTNRLFSLPRPRATSGADVVALVIVILGAQESAKDRDGLLTNELFQGSLHVGAYFESRDMP